MDIKRIDSYKDDRFKKNVLYQHGAYLADDEPCEIEITGPSEAVVMGGDPAAYKELIGEFRFHAPHISLFRDENGSTICEYPAPELKEIRLRDIQPSQFFIDEEKLSAVETFIHKPEDIVIQAMPYGERFISLDGHTRLYLAVRRGYDAVRAVLSETDDWVWTFVREAERRGICRPEDMMLLPHDEYEIKWNRYCDDVFAGTE